MSELSEMEVKLCPFCGGAAKIVKFKCEPHDDFWVECTERCVSMPPRETAGDAVADWNHRAPDPAIVEAWERMQSAQGEQESWEAMHALFVAVGEYVKKGGGI